MVFAPVFSDILLRFRDTLHLAITQSWFLREVTNQRMNQTGKMMRFYLKAVVDQKTSGPLVIRKR
jgi:hypothetical protein